jgi:hypothetical protein
MLKYGSCATKGTAGGRNDSARTPNPAIEIMAASSAIARRLTFVLWVMLSSVILLQTPDR